MVKSKTEYKLKSIPALLKRAQTVFNAFIRERDKNKPCVSCDGRVEQAGHYIPVGRSAGLRFSELNVNGQCAECNCFESGNLKEYRIGLIKRIGETSVIRLENQAFQVKKWSREELQSIIEMYKTTN